MQTLDHDYVEALIARLEAIPQDAKPLWGAMTRDTMAAHLAQAVRLSMGRPTPLPDNSTWFGRRVVGPLIINGILPMPKNVKSPMPAMDAAGKADIETFHALLEEYLTLVQADELKPAPHPYFGTIGVDGWAKLHVVHFEHHMKQFGQ